MFWPNYSLKLFKQATVVEYLNVSFFSLIITRMMSTYNYVENAVVAIIPFLFPVYIRKMICRNFLNRQLLLKYFDV